MNETLLNEKMKIEQLAIYYDVITDLLSSNNSLNATQICVFSYLKKKEIILDLKIYNKSNKNDVLFKVFSTAVGDEEVFRKNLPFILETLHLLVLAGRIIKDNDNRFHLKLNDYKKLGARKGTIIDLAILESQIYSESQLWREFLNYV